MMTAKEFDKKFEYELAEIIRNRKVNHLWLSEQTQIPLVSVHAYAQGRKMPSAYPAYKIATRLGMTVDQIAAGQEDKHDAFLVNTFLPSKEEFENTVRKNLDNLLKKHNLTRMQLSHITGIDAGAISKIYNGQRFPALTTIYMIAGSMGMKMNTLLQPVGAKEE